MGKQEIINPCISTIIRKDYDNGSINKSNFNYLFCITTTDF